MMSAAPAASSFAAPRAPSVKATLSRCQGVKGNFHHAARPPRARLPPALLFAARKDPQRTNARDTSPAKGKRRREAEVRRKLRTLFELSPRRIALSWRAVCQGPDSRRKKQIRTLAISN